MALLEIITPDNPVLRQKAQKVVRFNQELQDLVDNMIETMREANGVGLAAPQIGEGLQLAVIETLPREDKDGNDIPDSRTLHVIINPEIIWESHNMVAGVEGCLSIPGYVGEVNRHEAIRVKAQNRAGKKVSLHLKDWTARIFQHEIDHLQGILYTDRLTAPENYWTDEVYEQLLEAKHAVEEESELA